MAEEIFEQAINQQGQPCQGIPGGLNTIMEKLLELECKIDEIIEKVNGTLEVYTESQHARQG